MAAKRTSDIVPLCHSGVGLEGVEIHVEVVGPEEDGPREQGELPPRGNKGQGMGNKEGSKGNKREGRGTENDKERGVGPYGGVRIECRVECEGKTGVEMEALTGVVGAGLTVVDMVKGVDRGVRMEGVRVVRREGGRSGVWRVEGW